MKQLVFLVIAALAGFLLFSTCRQDQDGPGEEASQVGEASALAAPLQGRWTTGCVPDPVKEGVWSRDTREFSGTRLSTDFAAYSDPTCANGLIVQKQTGAFTVSEQEEVAGAFALDIGISSVTITLLTRSYVESYNQRRICGGSWELDVPKEISRQSCVGDGNEGRGDDTIFELAAIRDGILYFGRRDDSHSGRTAAGRPAAIEDTRPYSQARP